MRQNVWRRSNDRLRTGKVREELEEKTYKREESEEDQGETEESSNQIMFFYLFSNKTPAPAPAQHSWTLPRDSNCSLKLKIAFLALDRFRAEVGSNLPSDKCSSCSNFESRLANASNDCLAFFIPPSTSIILDRLRAILFDKGPTLGNTLLVDECIVHE